jgi:glucose/arabinose dehydrogenase
MQGETQTTWRRAWLGTLLGLVGILWCGNAGWTGEQEYREVSVTGHLVKPALREFDGSLVEQLQAPEGFHVSVFAQALGNPRMLAIDDDGTVYVTRREQGDVLALRDEDNDGRADDKGQVIVKLDTVHGITVHQDVLYLATPRQVFVADRPRDGRVVTPRLLIDGLPDGGQHPNRTLLFGPDGMLYISVGSSCNACDETNKEHATLLQARPDGSQRAVYALGLRNTIGFAWQPQTGELWGMDHGSDWRGDDQPPEELNRLQAGANYGWPFCYGDRQVDEHLSAEPPGTSRATYCRQTQAPVLVYQAHSAPMAMVFYQASQFPEEYRGDAFVAMRGSWNRKPAVGYKVVRIRFANGQPQGFEDFVSGFLIGNGREQFGRPVGLTVTRDGSLLVSDDTNGVIYRIAYVPTVRQR